MKIIQPKVELWKQGEDVKAHVARCARVCYGRESGNDEVTYNGLIKNHHWSMFRHETVYAMIPINFWNIILQFVLKYYEESPYVKWVTFKEHLYIVTNGNFLLDIKDNNPVLYKYISNYRVCEKEFLSCEWAYLHLARYTFCIDTQISTSRELNRVSPNNIAEQSTRYVHEDGTICKPHWMSDEKAKYYNDAIYVDIRDGILDSKDYMYLMSCKDSFNNYEKLIKEGMLRQDARGILPLDTATRCVYTYSIDEWRAILDLRYYGTTGEPHPNAKIIAGMIRNELMELGYKFK